MLPAGGLCPALWGCPARHSAFARPLLPPGVSGRGAVPGFTSAKEMSCLQKEEFSTAQNFALRANIWVPPSPSPRPGFWGLLGLYLPGSHVQHHTQFLVLPQTSAFTSTSTQTGNPRPVAP